MSTYYQNRMQADLDGILAKLREVSDLVESQVERAVEALLTNDRALASQVVLGDRQVNRRIKDIDRLCHAFVVRHAPSDEFLRRASAVLRLDVALERVGDYAGAIGREVGRLSGPPPDPVAEDFRAIAERAKSALSEALRAFHEGDLESARRGQVGGGIDADVAVLFETFHQAGDDGDMPLEEIFGFLHVLNVLMRVFEQAANVREQTLFALTGEAPAPRVYRVLFVDEMNDGASQLAEAYARAAFPSSGRYFSGGWNPAKRIDPKTLGLLESKGLAPMEGALPKRAGSVEDSGEHYNVIVLLSDEGREHIEPVPYRTTLVSWQLGAVADEDALYQAISRRVEGLMHTLAGPDAA